MRAPLSTVTWAAALFTAAGLGFQRLTDDPSVTLAADRRPLIGAALIVLVVAAAIALAGVVALALPSAIALVRAPDRRSLALVATPVVAVAAWFGLLRLGLTIARGHSVHSAAEIVAAVLVFGGGVAVVAITAWAASGVLRRVAASGPPRLRTVGLRVIAIGMAVASVAALVWGIAVLIAEPVGDRSRSGLLATPFLPSWVVVLAALVVATALASSALRRSDEAEVVRA
jgi:hypothetical protein